MVTLSGVSIRARPNLDILGEMFDTSSHSKTCAWYCFWCLSENLYFKVGKTYILRTPLCYFVAIMHLFSKSLSIVLRCGDQLLNVTSRLSRVRCIRWLGFAMIRVFYRCVIDVVLLGYECCTMLIHGCGAVLAMLVGLRSQFINKFVFPTWACLCCLFL